MANSGQLLFPPLMHSNGIPAVPEEKGWFGIISELVCRCIKAFHHVPLLHQDCVVTVTERVKEKNQSFHLEWLLRQKSHYCVHKFTHDYFSKIRVI